MPQCPCLGRQPECASESSCPVHALPDVLLDGIPPPDLATFRPACFVTVLAARPGSLSHLLHRKPGLAHRTEQVTNHRALKKKTRGRAEGGPSSEKLLGCDCVRPQVSSSVEASG